MACSTLVRTVTGKVSRVLGILNTMLEIDGHTGKIAFKAINELEQEMILGMDFCRVFDCDTRLGRGLWRVQEGSWHAFKDNNSGDEAAIYAECAGLTTLKVGQLARVYKLADKILSRQPEEPGVTNLIEHHIRVTDDFPSKHKLRRMSPMILEIAQMEAENWARDGIIERSASDYSSAPVLVKKSDGTYRICIYYRDLNKKKVKTLI